MNTAEQQISTDAPQDEPSTRTRRAAFTPRELHDLRNQQHRILNLLCSLNVRYERGPAPYAKGHEGRFARYRKAQMKVDRFIAKHGPGPYPDDSRANAPKRLSMKLQMYQAAVARIYKSATKLDKGAGRRWTIFDRATGDRILSDATTFQTYIWAVTKAYHRWEAKWDQLGQEAQLGRVKTFAREAGCTVRARYHAENRNVVLLIRSEGLCGTEPLGATLHPKLIAEALGRSPDYKSGWLTLEEAREFMRRFEAGRGRYQLPLLCPQRERFLTLFFQTEPHLIAKADILLEETKGIV